MRRLIVAALLMSFSSVADAQSSRWLPVLQGDGFKIYLDTVQVREAALSQRSTVDALFVYDSLKTMPSSYASAGGRGDSFKYRATEDRIRLDCVRQRYQMLRSIFLAGPDSAEVGKFFWPTARSMNRSFAGKISAASVACALIKAETERRTGQDSSRTP